MTEKHLLDQLEARARSASEDITHRAQTRPVPDFDPDIVPTIPGPDVQPATGRSRLPLYAVAAAVLALVAATIWVGTRDDDQADLADQVTVGALRQYIVGDEGLTPVGFQPYQFDTLSNSPDATSDFDIGPMAVFGPDERHPGAGVVVFTNDGFNQDEDGEAITVGDRTGVYLEQSPMGASVVLPSGTDPQSPLIMVLAPDLDRDQLVAIAAATTVSERVPTVADDGLPEDWHLLTDSGSLFSMTPQALARGGTIGDTAYFSAYGRGDDSGAMATLLVRAGPSADLHSGKLILTDTEDRTIRGHEGWVGRMADDSYFGDTWVVAWMERPGEILTLTVLGLDREAALAMAEAVEQVSPDRWDKLVLDSQLGEFNVFGVYGDGEILEMGRGTFADGTPWVLRLRPAEAPGGDGNEQDFLILSAALPSGGDSYSSSSGVAMSPEPGADPVLSWVNMTGHSTPDGPRVSASGLVRDDVARVELRAADATVLGEAQMVVAHGRTAWVADLPLDATDAVAFDAAGQQLGTTSVQRAKYEESFGDPSEFGSDTATTILEQIPAPDPVLPGD